MTPTPTITHPACEGSWTGLSTSHCARCCRTYSSTSAFERHWSDATGTCRHPEDAGLVPVTKPWGTMWSWPPSNRLPDSWA